MLNVLESLDFLKKSGFPVVSNVIVSSKIDVSKACKTLGFPLVLKIISSSHKSDVGGVITNINSVNEAVTAFNKLKKLSSTILFQKQSEGVELVLGVKKDPVFNQVIMFGLGGVFVEVIKDVSFRVCPINETEALSMINELKGVALLTGYRSKEKIDLNALTKLIVKLSQTAVSKDIKELDLNPIFAKGKNFFIVDARLEL